MSCKYCPGCHSGIEYLTPMLDHSTEICEACRLRMTACNNPVALPGINTVTAEPAAPLFPGLAKMQSFASPLIISDADIERIAQRTAVVLKEMIARDLVAVQEQAVNAATDIAARCMTRGCSNPARFKIQGGFTATAYACKLHKDSMMTVNSVAIPL